MDPSRQRMREVLEKTVERSVYTADARPALTQEVEALIARLRPSVCFERRHHERVAIPFLLRMVPLDKQGNLISEEEKTVIGKDLSSRGLGFFHEEPLPHRRAILSLEHPDLGNFSVEMDLTWCRFTKLGWYESGGRLLRTVEQKLPRAKAG